MLLSPCRHHQWEILLPPALHQPPLLLRSIFKQRQNSRATSVCRAWQVCAGPQRGMAQLSFGGISGGKHGLPGPEFESNAPKVVPELYTGFCNSKLQEAHMCIVSFNGRGDIFETWGVLLVGSKFCLTVCKRIHVLLELSLKRTSLVAAIHDAVSQQIQCG